MTQKILTHCEAVEMRMEGLEAMARVMAEYDVAGQPALMVIYPGGGWALLNTDTFDVNSELRRQAEKQYEEFRKRR